MRLTRRGFPTSESSDSIFRDIDSREGSDAWVGRWRSPGWTTRQRNCGQQPARAATLPRFAAFWRSHWFWTATLAGKQLTITGTFEGLRSPATTVQIRRGPKGIRGPTIPDLDLTVSKAVKGTLSGSVELTPEQIVDLRSGRLYVQIQSERAPDGNLWGWLLR